MKAFEELFNQYFVRVYRFALALTRNENAAEELTQQTFFKALKRFDSFQGHCDPATWLCSIAKNEYFNGAKRNRLQVYEPDFDQDFCSVDEALVEREQMMRIHRLLHEMKEPYREVFSLRIFSELKFSQIASLFSKTEGWARVTYYRAKCELQNKIREEDECGK